MAIDLRRDEDRPNSKSKRHRKRLVRFATIWSDSWAADSLKNIFRNGNKFIYRPRLPYKASASYEMSLMYDRALCGRQTACFYF